MEKVILDAAATTKPKQEVVDYAIEIMKNYWQNPNSIYDSGLAARSIIDNARQIVADKINAEPNEIIFCPSASAANSLAILGYLRKNRVEKFITSNIEHSSILDIKMPFYVKRDLIKCDDKGIIDSSLLKKYKNSLVSIIGANNEIGTVQNLCELSKVAHKNGCVFHSDLTQYIPHFSVDVKAMGLDMATFSAHKLGGLRGCAVLYVKDGIDLEPLVYGHQEDGLMAGTENVVAIAAMGKAMELLNYSNWRKIISLRDYLIWRLFEIDPKVTINGDLFNRLPNNVNVCIHNMSIDIQQLISCLELGGFEVSAGSACNAGANTPSHVLRAIGLSDDNANKSIRITIGDEITKQDVDDFVCCLKNILDMYTS